MGLLRKKGNNGEGYAFLIFAIGFSVNQAGRSALKEHNGSNETDQHENLSVRYSTSSLLAICGDTILILEFPATR